MVSFAMIQHANIRKYDDADNLLRSPRKVRGSLVEYGRLGNWTG